MTASACGRSAPQRSARRSSGRSSATANPCRSTAIPSSTMKTPTDQELLAAFADQTVLIVGDVMLDEYIWGDVRRISPEAPVPVVQTRHRTYRPGGAGNVAANIAALGATALLCGVVGDD